MSFRNHVILIAEDDPNDVLLFQLACERVKLMNPLHNVRDGEEAIGYLSGRAQYADRELYPLPVLLLLDLKMPRKNGFEVLHWLRGQSGLKRLPAVILTSSSQTSDVNQAYDLGANSYLVKPTSLDRLAQVIRSLETYWLTLCEKPDLRSA